MEVRLVEGDSFYRLICSTDQEELMQVLEVLMHAKTTRVGWRRHILQAPNHGQKDLPVQNTCQIKNTSLVHKNCNDGISTMVVIAKRSPITFHVTNLWVPVFGPKKSDLHKIDDEHTIRRFIIV